MKGSQLLTSEVPPGSCGLEAAELHGLPLIFTAQAAKCLFSILFVTSGLVEKSLQTNSASATQALVFNKTGKPERKRVFRPSATFLSLRAWTVKEKC